MNQVKIFNPHNLHNLSSIHEEESQELTGRKSIRRNVYLSLNAIESLDKSPTSKSPVPMDAKSSTSRKTSLHKFKLKAKNHLFASSATIREIAQVPIPEQPLGDRVVSYQQPDGSTVKKKLAAEVLIQEDDEVVAKLRERLAKDVSSPIST